MDVQLILTKISNLKNQRKNALKKILKNSIEEPQLFSNKTNLNTLSQQHNQK